jgi:hypothetical protein
MRAELYTGSGSNQAYAEHNADFMWVKAWLIDQENDDMIMHQETTYRFGYEKWSVNFGEKAISACYNPVNKNCLLYFPNTLVNVTAMTVFRFKHERLEEHDFTLIGSTEDNADFIKAVKQSCKK